MKVRFHPQAWINDYAVEVDAHGDTEFDVGEIPPDIADNTYESDQLQGHPNAPRWVRDWSGPFWIEILRDPDAD
jgi:hypothetical protein